MPSKEKAKAQKPKKKAKKIAKAKKPAVAQATSEAKAQILSSEVAYEGPLFRVMHDKLIEPDGLHSERDVIRHNGSVVILAIDSSRNKKNSRNKKSTGNKKNPGSKKNPWIVMERQYRHAANQYLWELPAGKLDQGEDPLAGAKRELAEETGYSAKNWKPLVEYYPSPGFLGESMQVFLAEGLLAGEARPEEDEKIEFRLVKLADAVKMIEKGAIKDGKTLTGVLLYARLTGSKGKK